jgi:septal ring factor EnvC (AmiA/AmiB activator)
MKKVLVCFVLIFSVCALSFSQTDEQKQQDIANFRARIHQLEIYNYVLPVLLKKDQLRSLLTEIEKVRQKRREILDAEYKVMNQLNARVDEAITAASTKGAVPGQELVSDLYGATQRTQLVMMMWTNESVDVLYTTVLAVLDKGQQTVMAKTLNPKDFPNELKKPEEVTQAERIKIFIKYVLLDPDAYNLLVKMSI